MTTTGAAHRGRPSLSRAAAGAYFLLPSADALRWWPRQGGHLDGAPARLAGAPSPLPPRPWTAAARLATAAAREWARVWANALPARMTPTRTAVRDAPALAARPVL